MVYEADAPKGQIARNLEPDRTEAIRATCGLSAGDADFFVASKVEMVARSEELSLGEAGAFRFCWITDFPMFALNEETGQVDFSHNPFSTAAC